MDLDMMHSSIPKDVKEIRRNVKLNKNKVKFGLIALAYMYLLQSLSLKSYLSTMNRALSLTIFQLAIKMAVNSGKCLQDYPAVACRRTVPLGFANPQDSHSQTCGEEIETLMHFRFFLITQN